MLSFRFPAAGPIAAALGLAALILVVSPSSGAEPSTVDEKTMEAWWADLEKGETAATRALLKLSDRPKDAAAFLKTKMKPLTISSGQVKALLLKLGSDNEKVWKPAFEELEYFDPRLAIDLQALMDRYKEPPGRQRLVEVMSGGQVAVGSLKRKDVQLRKSRSNDFNFDDGQFSWWAEWRVDRISTRSWDAKKKWTRAVCAIVLMEHIGTPDAMAILKDMATGHPDAYPTKVAKESSPSSGADPSTGDEKTMEAWWSGLEKGETAATRALLKLSDRPKDAAAFLKTKMKPLTISSGQVKALLLKLGNANEAVWKPAFEELEYFDPRLAIDLPTLMDRYKEPPGRQRLVEVMSGRKADSLKGKDVQLRKSGGPDDFNFFDGRSSWWAECRVDRINTRPWDPKKKWTRAVRAIMLLEHIGTPDAVAILKDMASGHPDAYLTKVAKEALKTADK